MKILVTGGTGFTGFTLIQHIIKNTSDSVINVDKFTYVSNLESLIEVSNHTRYSFENADICHHDTIDSILAKYQPDAIMHLAAESHIDRSINSQSDFIQTNIISTYTLLEAAKNYWRQLVEDKKSGFIFHHISTDEVYGDLTHPDQFPKNYPLPLFTEKTLMLQVAYIRHQKHPATM